MDACELRKYSLLLLSVFRPCIEYGSEVWEGIKSHVGFLESIILDAAMWILDVLLRPATRLDRYPKQLFNQEWIIRRCRGWQMKVCSRMRDDLFKSLRYT